MQELKEAVKAYVDALSSVSVVGTPELSHYISISHDTPLDNLFDAIGKQLSPEAPAVVRENAGERDTLRAALVDDGRIIDCGGDRRRPVGHRDRDVERVADAVAI